MMVDSFVLFPIVQNNSSVSFINIDIIFGSKLYLFYYVNEFSPNSFGIMSYFKNRYSVLSNTFSGSLEIIS